MRERFKWSIMRKMLELMKVVPTALSYVEPACGCEAALAGE
ncbi:MAG: hypothetical protein ACLUKN_12730 [Bacilli bacterium]